MVRSALTRLRRTDVITHVISTSMCGKSPTFHIYVYVYIFGLTTLNKPKSREVSTNDGISTHNIFIAADPTSSETK